MRFGLPNLVPQTLRFRLLLWNTAVVLLMVMPTLAVVRLVVRQRLFQDFDQLLSEDAEEIKLAIKQLGLEREAIFKEMERRAQGHNHRGWFVQFCDAQGRLRRSCPAKPALQVDVPPDDRLQFVEDDHCRLVQFRLTSAKRPPLIVRVGASLQGVREDVDLITNTMILAAGMMLVLAPLGGYLLAVRATQPVQAFTDLAARVRSGHLNERLPIHPTGDELEQLARTINYLLDSIAAFIQQKRDFIANAAHELRSPLAAITSTVEVALTNPRSPEEYGNLLTDILEECHNLNALINQLLLLAESDADRLAFRGQSVRFDHLVHRSVTMFQGVAEANGVELRQTGLPAVLVRGDEHYLRQVINNLLDNAIKFTPPGGRVDIEVTARWEEQVVTLCIRDTGIGLTAEELPRIFERFYRGDRARPREGERRGTGLGLSICQAIVVALQGRIEVQSTLGQGTTFTVHLPMPEADRSPAHQGGAPGQARAETT